MIAGDAGASEALQAAAVSALAAVAGLGVYEGQPVQAAMPYASVDAGLETDWGHKEGYGREVRLAVTLRDRGEPPARLRRLTRETAAALAGLEGPVGRWRLVTMHFLRSRTVAEGRGGWAAVIELRARMLAL